MTYVLEKDAADHNYFHVKYVAGKTVAYAFTIHTDVIWDMFGAEFQSQVATMKCGEQWNIDLTIAVSED